MSDHAQDGKKVRELRPPRLHLPARLLRGGLPELRGQIDFLTFCRQEPFVFILNSAQGFGLHVFQKR